MTRYWFASLFVAAAVVTMVALGLWQLQRADEKAQLRTLYTQNQRLPAVALAALDTSDPRTLFRTVTAVCADPTRIDVDSGRARGDGASGWRNIATCAAAGGAPALLVDIGISDGPEGVGQWAGGPVQGTLVTEPQRYGVLTRIMGNAPPLRPMIVAQSAAPGLSPSLPPDPAEMRDDHLSYAIQWFIFAFAAALIFALALRQRLKQRAGGGATSDTTAAP